MAHGCFVPISAGLISGGEVAALPPPQGHAHHYPNVNYLQCRLSTFFPDHYSKQLVHQGLFLDAFHYLRVGHCSHVRMHGVHWSRQVYVLTMPRKLTTGRWQLWVAPKQANHSKYESTQLSPILKTNAYTANNTLLPHIVSSLPAGLMREWRAISVCATLSSLTTSG